MRAATLAGPSSMVVETVPEPQAHDGEVLVRMSHAAVCGSDLERIFGQSEITSYPAPPGFPGHEGVGIVDGNSIDGLNVGDLVLTLPAGPHARAFAELQAVDAGQVIRAPAGIDPVDLLMAQQLGTVLFAMSRFWSGSPGETAAVFGSGPAGLHFIQVLKHLGFGTVIASDLSGDRLRMASRFGADIVTDNHDDSAVDVVMDVTNGRGASLSIDASGRDNVRVQAMRSVAFGGIVGLYGLPETRGLSEFPFHEIFRRHVTIKTCVGAQNEPGLASFRKGVDLIATRVLRGKEMVTHFVDLEHIDDAFQLAQSRADGVIKVCITFP